MKIRIAREQDFESIKKVYYSAFPKDECEIVAQLAIDLLSEDTTPQTISLIGEIDDSIVGHIAFSPVVIEGSESSQAYILAPLAVQPDHQKNCIGSSLIEHGMQQLLALGVNVVFVYGDPNYYARFGFRAETAHSYTTPYELEYPSGWQATVLNSFTIAEKPVAISCVASLCDPKYW
jgi:putative acetyltransferase